MAFPEHIIRYLQEEAADVDPDHPCFRNDEVKVIASARSSLEAAAELARRRGVPAVVLSDAIEGQAREITKVHAAIEGGRAQRPAVPQAVVILSGGESTVTLRGEGEGGRNTEFLLSLVIEIAEHEEIALTRQS